MFYSGNTGGFYDAVNHGALKLSIVDPAFVWPQIEVGSEDGVELINDPGVLPPMVEIDNPDTKIPAGAIEISAAEYQALIEGQASGKCITADAAGRPVLADHPVQTPAQMWEHIKSERDRRRFDGGVKVGAHWFQTTAVATSEYNSLALIAAGLPGGTVLRAGWRTMDGGLVEMTPDLVRQILVAGFATVAAIDDAAQAHKAALAVSSDPAAYDFSAGWPAIYEA